MGRGIAIVLAASLGINFFLAGFLMHDVINPPPARPPFDAGQGFDGFRGFPGVAQNLSPEHRQVFRAAFVQQLPSMRGHHQEMRKLRSELRVLIEADDWDGDAIAAKQGDIRALRAQQSEAFDRALVAAFGALPAEERRRMVEMVEKRRMEMRNRPRRPMGPPPQ